MEEEKLPRVPEGCELLVTPVALSLKTPKLKVALRASRSELSPDEWCAVKYLASLALADACTGTKETAAWMNWGREV